MPQTVLDDALKDENRIANVALNKEGKVVGSSFCIVIINMKVMIHQTMLFMYVHCQLMKSFKAMDMGQNDDVLPEYVQALFPDFTHLYLVVDAENQSAWNVYERAGFMHTATKKKDLLGKKDFII